MLIVRQHNPHGWTSLPTALHEDGNLTFKARGLLAYLLSRPPEWRTNSEILARSMHAQRDGRDGIRSGLSELERAGYLVRKKSQDKKSGKWSTEAQIYDTPQNGPLVPLSDVEPPP